jgi:hypothetical protein
MVVEDVVIVEHLLEVLRVGAAGFCNTCPALALAFAICCDFRTIVPSLATAGTRSAASSGGEPALSRKERGSPLDRASLARRDERISSIPPHPHQYTRGRG